MESARVIRRAAKGKMTRQIKTAQRFMSEGQSSEEVQAAMENVKAVYRDLSEKHECYCSLLTDDLLNDVEEEWMDVCHNEMLNLEIAANNYARERSTATSENHPDKEKEVPLVGKNPSSSRIDTELPRQMVGDLGTQPGKTFAIQNECSYGGPSSISLYQDNTPPVTQVHVENMQPHVLIETNDYVPQALPDLGNVQDVMSAMAVGDNGNSALLLPHHSQNTSPPSAHYAQLSSSLPACNTPMSSLFPTGTRMPMQPGYNAAQMSSSLPLCNTHIPSSYPAFNGHMSSLPPRTNAQVSFSLPTHNAQIAPLPTYSSHSPSMPVNDGVMPFPSYSDRMSSSLPTSNVQVSSSIPTHNIHVPHSLPSYNAHGSCSIPVNNSMFPAPVHMLPSNTAFQERNVNSNAFNIKREFIPKFSGDVREYGIFRADFKHIVEKNCSGRDAITLLRSSLTGKAADLIRGITTDYMAAWAYLDAVYGDPRYVADAITHDISSFPALRSNEDSRFCDFVHMLRRSYNTLNELQRAEDMNNNHILAIIEQKLCSEDRKIWSRDLQKERKPATFLILMDWLTNEMTARMRSSAPLRNSVQSNQRINHVIAETGRSGDEGMSRDKCWICHTTDHWIDQCDVLKQLSPNERLQKIRDNHACFCCLKKAGRNHTSATCYRRRQCTENVGFERCKMFHHQLLHGGYHNSAVGVASLSANSAMLPVVSVKAIGTHGRQVVANAMLDTGAQISLIRNDLAEELGLKGKHVTITLNKVGGEIQEMHTKVYEIRIQPLNQTRTYNVSVIGIPIISDEIPQIQELKDIARMLSIPYGQLRRGHGNIDILIGIDHPKMHIGETREKNDIIARHSPLGWLIFGSTGGSSTVSSVLHVAIARPVDLSEFWTTESMGVSVKDCTCKCTLESQQEREEGKIIEGNCKKVGNRWEIGYPWKRDPRDLPDNKLQVFNRMVSTEKRLAKSEEHAKAYNAQIKEMENMEFSRKLTDEEIKGYEGPVHYIAHHAVLRPESKSTPVRIVFNTSASYQGHKLNDYWYKGPDLLNDMFGVIIRFRENPVAICSDISKMYHRILIPEEDQHVHRFMWRDLDVEREPDIYVKTVLTFGDRPAPAMAQTALRKTALENEDRYPDAAKVIKDNVYMDDICESVENEQKAEALMKDIDEVLDTGGFQVKSWITTNHGSTNGDKPCENVLGLKWCSNEDTPSLAIKVDICQNQDVRTESLTKRIILSNVARVYDPLGFASAFIVKAKIGIQKLWQRGLDWDDEVPDDLRDEWFEFFTAMDELKTISFDRSLRQSDVIGRPTLCIFSDASNDAFGTCAYIRWNLSSGCYGVHLIAAKSRVAPLKELSIPRLELQGAVMAARLYKAITEESRFRFDDAYFFVDSMIVLAWVRGQSKRYKPFVSVRIGEIQDTTDPKQWRHIPGELNVADDVSRGINPSNLQERWVNGPQFLTMPIEEWPKTTEESIDTDVDMECRKSVNIFNVKEDVINCRYFSNWKRLVRVTAYVFRFIQNMKCTLNKSTDTQMDTENACELSTSETDAAELHWVKQAQIGLKERIEKGELKSLSPFVGPGGEIRVGGRADRALLSYDNKHPVLISNKHWIATLITRYFHQLGHFGVASTVAKVQRKYWIIKAHKVAKTVKFRCVTCKRLNATTESQVMVDLPPQRLAPYTPPFYYTACDYFGPYTVKIGRNKTTKHYGVLFTCLNTRAVHLEMAVDYSTQEFLQALRRFFAMRGQPASITSDNGSQLVGAEKELRLMIQGWDKESLRRFSADRQMEWRFTTPLAPHHNGCAESMVKISKRALKVAMGDAVLAPMELYTCLLEAANLINQRPIGRNPNDPDDGAYLSPNDILLGRSSSDIPQGPFRYTTNPRHRVEFVQRIVDSFWKRWSRDVFPALLIKKKWHTETRNVREDDVVIVADPNALRGQWSTGRVTDVYPGADGKVRSIKVKTSNGQYTRPITKIVVIHPAEGFEDAITPPPEDVHST